MIELHRYTSSEESRWERFVADSNNGTIFHTRKFLSYHPESRFQDHSLLFEKKGKLLALFPAAERIKDQQKILWSHPGSSYGSLVVPETLSFQDALGLVNALTRYGQTHGFSAIRLTLPPTIYNRRLSNYIDYALLHHGFMYINREVSSILFLESSVEKNLAKFKPSHRRAVRKAEKSGVIVRESDDFAAFYTILKNNLRIRHGVEPTHTLDELLRLKALFP
ncbi:MAG: GNAT family N-acetyltransferase, partial [FCB group bacterium]|nr:GNAT family N-acetyltransferase [FCB group bacterium]